MRLEVIRILLLSVLLVVGTELLGASTGTLNSSADTLTRKQRKQELKAEEENELHKDTLMLNTGELLTAKDISILKPSNKKPHSPHKATIMAMLLPGSGQIYNGQWWKLPVVYGGLGAALYGLDWNTRTYKKYRSAFADYVNYRTAKEADPALEYPLNNSWDKLLIGDRTANDEGFNQQWFQDILQRKKNNYKHDKELMIFVTAGAYIITILDATVFAHFYDFEIDENLSAKLQPASGATREFGTNLGMSLTFTF